jgi:glycosyltransferase involved in cell wall biosynthesis
LELEDCFIAIYAGIHGIAQGLETVIEAARLLEGHNRIHLLLVGDGPKKAELSTLAQELSLSNLTMLPEQPRAQIIDYLSAADIALIPLRDLELFRNALPSKMFDAWACELPLLLSVDGEAQRIMELAEGGVFVPPENPTTLAETLRQLAAQPAICQEMGKRGREFTVKQYSRQAQAEKLITLLSAVLHKGRKEKAS